MGVWRFHGTKGTMLLGRDGYEIIPTKKRKPVNIVPKSSAGTPSAGPQPEPEEAGQFWTEAAKDKTGDWKSQYVDHARNFLDCIKSRKQPNSDLESGTPGGTVCHLANNFAEAWKKNSMGCREGAGHWDQEAERMLERVYRSPWDAELRA